MSWNSITVSVTCAQKMSGILSRSNRQNRLVRTTITWTIKTRKSATESVYVITIICTETTQQKNNLTPCFSKGLSFNKYFDKNESIQFFYDMFKYMISMSLPNFFDLLFVNRKYSDS